MSEGMEKNEYREQRINNMQALVDKGVTYEANYPYSEGLAADLSAHDADPVVKFASWGRVSPNDVEGIKRAIYTYGAVDAAVYSDTFAFDGYTSGIYQDGQGSCPNGAYTETDHSIALVGWGEDPQSGAYFILRNSWGADWGENGYMRIDADAARVTCAVAYMHYPTPEPVDCSQAGPYAYYVPYFTNQNGFWSGLALANENATSPASICYEVRDANGTVVDFASSTLPAAGQRSIAMAEDAATDGWVRVRSDQPLSGLSFVGNSDAPGYMTDIPFTATASANLKLPHVSQDGNWDTTIYLANPGSASVDVRVRNIGAEGETVATSELSIPANGAATFPLSAMNATTDISGTVTITANTGIVAFGLYSSIKSGLYNFAGIGAVETAAFTETNSTNSTEDGETGDEDDDASENDTTTEP